VRTYPTVYRYGSAPTTSPLETVPDGHVDFLRERIDGRVGR